jgi:hypothetical protein
MRRAPTLEKSRQRRSPAPVHVRRNPFRPAARCNWLELPDVDEGPDAAVRELIERIARGDLIRGHAL